MRDSTTPSRPVRAVRGTAGAIAVLATLSAFWVGAYYGVAWLAARLHLHPAGPALQVVASIAGLLLFGVLAGTLGSRHRGREVDAWRQLVDALRRIAEGDFSVRLEPFGQSGRHPFASLAAGVNDMAEELDRLERMRQDFIADVSHEIQSPLASIGGFARALRQDEPGPAERERYLRIIETEVARLSQLSDHLLRLAALEGEGRQLELRGYRLDAQVQRAVLASEPQWTRKGLELKADLEPVTVVADEALLDQVWTNLLNNAIKFTPAGGTVAVRVRRSGGRAAATIEDSGIGIPLEDQERVFERFFKADRARHRELGGSGLGLALVRRIVELHGGSVALESAPGRGTRVSIEVPGAPDGQRGRAAGGSSTGAASERPLPPRELSS